MSELILPVSALLTPENSKNKPDLYICVIDQALGQDGWISANYYFFYLFIIFIGVFMDRDEVKVHKNAKEKKEQGQYPAILTEQAWSIKDLLYDFIFKLKLQKQ